MSNHNLRRAIFALTLSMVYFTMAAVTTAATIHVSPFGSDASSGDSWGTAKRTITAALAAAKSGDDIWVGKGHYKERLVLKSNVALYGGFDMTETSLSQRDWEDNSTTIDGDYSGITVYGQNIGAGRTRVDGFVITGASLTGISLHNVAASLENNIVVGNWSEYNGGGLYLGTSNCNVINCHFYDNHQTRSNWSGGAVSVISGASKFYRCTFRYNTAASPTSYGGGAIYLENTTSEVTSCVFEGNASQRGSAIRISGGAPKIVCNTFVKNIESQALYVTNAAPVLYNNIIAWNDGGVYLSGYGGAGGSNCIYQNAYGNDGIGQGDKFIDPRFVNLASGDVHLRPDSQCVNAGSNGYVQTEWLDIDGEPRTMFARVDIGADEYSRALIGSIAVGAGYAHVKGVSVDTVLSGSRARTDRRRYDARVSIDCGSEGFVSLQVEVDGIPNEFPKVLRLPSGVTSYDLVLPEIPNGAHIITVIVKGKNSKSDFFISYSTGYDPNTHGIYFDNHATLLSWSGLCVGMSYTSARRYAGEVPDYIWNDPIQLDAYAQVTDAWVKQNALFVAKELEMFAVDSANRASYVQDQVRQLRLALTAGSPTCIGLGNTANVLDTRHAVVAHTLFDLGGSYVIGVYDPNFGPTPPRDWSIIQRVYTSVDGNGLRANLDSVGYPMNSFDMFTVLPKL